MFEKERKNHHGKNFLILVIASIFLVSFSVLPHNAFADTVISTIPVGNYPTAVAVNPNTNMIYVANTNNNTISVIDGKTNTVVNTLRVLTTPYGIAVNPNTNLIYVAENTAWQPNPKAVIQMINGSTNQIITMITPQLYPYDLRVNPTTNKIYVLENSGFQIGGPTGAIQVINGTTGAVASTINTAPLQNHGIALNPTTNMIYVFSYSDISLSVINGTSDAITSQIPRLCGYGLAVNPSTNTLYSTCGGSVQVVDLSTSSIIDTVSASAFDIDVNLATNKIYVTNPGDSNTDTTLAIIDGSTNTVMQKVTVGNGPSGVAVNSVTNKIYITNQGSNTVSVIDGNSPTPPQSPTGLTVTPKMPPQIDLSWTAPSDNGGSTIMGYMIERSTDNGTTWSTLVQNTGNTEIAYTDSHLVPVKTYTYRVSAINGMGTSDPSNTASARPLSAHGHP